MDTQFRMSQGMATHQTFLGSNAGTLMKDDQSKRSLWCLQNIEIYEALEQAISELKGDYLKRHGYFGKDDPEINSKIIELLDVAIELGHWEGSLFFENAGQQLKKLREQLAKRLDCSDSQAVEKNDVLKKVGHRMVFISLYQLGGEVLKNWEHHLQTIQSHSIGRPIYAKESEVKRRIATKLNKKPEAYISVWIPENSVLPQKNQPQQPQLKSSTLLSVKDGSVRAENIIHFINYSGRYRYESRQLIRAE